MKKTQIHFIFNDVFTAVVIFVAYKVPSGTQRRFPAF